MIRTKREYQKATQRLREERERLAEQHKHLKEMGLAADEVKHALDPLRSFHEQLAEEVERYERLEQGELSKPWPLHKLGIALIELRIARGLTQRELAKRLAVHESQISREERNEYRGVTLKRAVRVLDALGFEFELVSKIDSGTRATTKGDQR